MGCVLCYFLSSPPPPPTATMPIPTDSNNCTPEWLLGQSIVVQTIQMMITLVITKKKKMAMVTRTIMKMIIIRIINLIMQQHQNFSSSFQPIKKKKILPSSSSSSGGGGSIPCGRGPLGSYLDGMESARDTASDDTDDAVTEMTRMQTTTTTPLFLSMHSIKQDKATMSTIQMQYLGTYLLASSSSSSSYMDVTDTTIFLFTRWCQGRIFVIC